MNGDELALFEVSSSNGDPVTNENGEILLFPKAISQECMSSNFNKEDIFLTQEVVVLVEKEVECDLSGLEIQVNERHRLNTQNKSQLIQAYIPDKIENSDCEVSYTDEWAVISQEFTGIVSEAFETISPNFGEGSIIPGETSGKNGSQNAIFSSVINDQGDSAWFEIEIKQNELVFNQITQTTANVTMGSQSAYNGEYILEMQNGNGADPGDHRLYKKGVGGWKTINISEWFEVANLWYDEVNYINDIPLHKLSNNGSQGILVMNDGRFLLTGNRSDISNQEPTASSDSGGNVYAVIYDPVNDEFTPYEFPNITTNNWKGILGCEAENPDDLRRGIPSEFYLDNNLMICRNIKNIRFSSFQPLKERYGDWLISGDWPNGIQAHNIATNENTGILSYKDRPTGNMSWLDESHRTYAAFNERYRNYIHVVAKNSSQNYDFLRRFNLDDSSFTDFDLTQYDYEFNSYKVYKDLVLFDVTDSNDGMRKYIEFNFDTGEVSDRGTIDEGGFIIIGFVGNAN